jgi:hypothetical protein
MRRVMHVAIERESARVVKVQLSGSVTARQWHAAVMDIANMLKPDEQTGILVAAEGFEGWGAGEWDDLSFQRELDSKIGRMAIVAETKWEDLALMFAGKGLRRIEIEFFPPEQIARARQWLTSSDGKAKA